MNPLSGSDGPVARLDPRGRVVVVVLFAILVVSLHDFRALGAAVAVGAVALLTARLPLARTLKMVATMDGFIVFMLVMLPFTTPGETLFTLWGFEGTREGLYKAIEIGLKANAVVMVLLALVGTMETVTLGHALHHLRVPENLVHLLLFTVRYIEVLHQEYLRLRTAMKARGFRARNDRHTYRSVGYLLGMMLVRALERSERILGAMKCRGYEGRLHILAEHRFAARDAVFAGLAGGVGAGLLALEFTA